MFPPAIVGLGEAIATPATAIAANAAMNFILFIVWSLSVLVVIRFRQMEAPMSPPTSPPMSDAPISHQSSVWSVLPRWSPWCFGSW